MGLGLAPYVATPSKTLFHPSRVDAFVAESAKMARGIQHIMAVIVDGRTVGLVTGHADLNRVTYTPITHRQWCGFESWTALRAAVKAGKSYSVYFQKDFSGFSLANRWFDMWPSGAVPASGTYSGTANTARQFSNTTSGGLNLGPLPASGETKHLIGCTYYCVPGTNSVSQFQFLYDRVLSYDGTTISTTLQTMTNTLTAQRYIGSSDPGLMLVTTTQVTTGLGATASSYTTITYTDNNGNTGQTVPTTDTLEIFANAAAGSNILPAIVIAPYDGSVSQGFSPFIPMATGDTGMRAVESYQASANNTGNVCFVLVKPLAFNWTAASKIVHRIDYSQSMFCLPRLFDDACLSWMGIQSSGNASVVRGALRVACG